MSMSAGYSSPSLELDEIAMVIRAWGCQVTPEDLRPPKGLKPEVIQRIYACAIHKLTDLTIEELEQSAEQSLVVIEEWQELIAPSARLHVLLYHATRVADGAGIEDFSMMDLVSPEPARTRSCLSAIINFGRFSEERLPFVEGLQQQYLRASAERDELQHEIETMRQRLENHKTRLKADEPICTQLTIENRTLTDNLVDLAAESKATMQESGAYKKERDSQVVRKTDNQNQINIALERNERTQSRIVQSPDRIKRAISAMGMGVQEERRNISANESKARALKLKLDNLLAYEQDIQLNIRHLSALAVEQESLEETLGKLARARVELEKYSVMRKELELKQDRVERRKANAEQKLEREQKYADDHHDRSKETIAKLKKEFEEMSVERRDNDHLVEESKREAASIERKMAEHLRQNEEDMTKLLAEYWRLRHQTEVYMETLANKLGLDVEEMATS